ncbi:AraC family transcriptional regulator [Aequorivita sp. H23M31]|uniref:AraC family transcriptional regulator n=1 Tax=Aequorivita ciconiae TaxID=2494375 RepID=A0A410G0V8_9FLAO|nr:AraC family transcriptional regulator [Aequorivita sp. H23M31]QAA80908.1 AraC family transcriptional regulator [Aequorivita sp. H23M31]
MQTILSHSIPLKLVLQDLAKEFGVTVNKECNEYSISIPANYGTGKITGIDFEDGLGLIFYDCTFLEDLQIRFIVDKIHPLKFIFCEQGKISHQFENQTSWHSLDVLDNIIVASDHKNGHILRFKSGVRTVVNSLEINREEFLSHRECSLEGIGKNMGDILKDTNASYPFYHTSLYSVKIADLFIEIDEFDEDAFLRSLFLESMSLKILINQILQYQDDLELPENKTVLRTSEMKLIKEAANKIDENILDFSSVHTLSQEVGMNINKLQNGFKAIFNTTVNNYVQNQRLDLANQLLRNSELSISEIVYRVGLSSKSYFSKIYKNKYGCSPSDIRKRQNRSS